MAQGTGDGGSWDEAAPGGSSVPPVDPGSPRPMPGDWPPAAPLDPWAATTTIEPPSSPPPSTPPSPPGRDGGSSAFRVAFLAAILSSLLTAVLVLLVVQAFPGGAAPTPAPGATAGATGSPTASASAAPSASPAPSPSPVPSATPEPSGAAVDVPPTSPVAVLVREALPSVVTITTQTDVGYGRFGPATGVGSGIIFDSAGWILTNGHVVDGATSIVVQLQDGRQLDGKVYGIASATDLAIVKVDATGLPALGLDASRALEIGDDVIAIGTPLGDYPGSVSTGVVSGLARSISIRGLGTLDGLIQTDAAVNPGNSGGPLLDGSGRVVGVTTATSSSAQGISFAIPIDVARPYMADALAGKPIP
jgi:S1-C subfamily serine protease